MPRPRIQARRGCELHHAPEIQHQYALAQLPHQRQIVTDEQQAHVRLALQVREQGHDLLLGRDIQRTDRLVADEQTGLQDRGAGDADTLALSAGELVRVAARELGGESHAAQHRGELRGARGAIEIRGVHPRRLAHDLADRHARIEASQRVLEDDLQIASQRAQHTLGQIRERLPHPHDATGGGAQQLQRGAHEGRLAAAGFAHHPERLAGAQLQTHRAHGREPTEAHGEVRQPQGRGGPRRRCCGAGWCGIDVQARADRRGADQLLGGDASRHSGSVPFDQVGLPISTLSHNGCVGRARRRVRRQSC